VPFKGLIFSAKDAKIGLFSALIKAIATVSARSPTTPSQLGFMSKLRGGNRKN
jgi:hypothetical protein